MVQIAHTSFLQSRANLLIIPVGSDGTILNKTLLRLMTLYPSCRHEYHDLATRGQLALGDAILHKIAKQTMGLGAGTNTTHDYIALLVTQNHPSHTEQLSTLTTACKSLHPKLYRLMRYEGLRHVAIFAQTWIKTTDTPSDSTCRPIHQNTKTEAILALINDTLAMSQVRIEVYC